MNKNILSMTLVAGSIAFSAGAQATFIIDDFSVSTSEVSAPGSVTSNLGASSDFSLTRDLSIISTGVTTSTVIVTSGILGISTGVGATANTTSGYSNAAGFDFTAVETGGGSIFDAFILDLISIDQGGVTITLTVDGTSASQAVNAPGDILFPHSLFGDVSNVNTIEYFIVNNLEVDATFDSLGSFGSQAVVPPVPEPTALALLGMGLAAFGFGRRKAK